MRRHQFCFVLDRARIMLSRGGWALLCLVGLSVCGCTQHSGLEPVTGTVTFQGQPLDQGAIQFLPVESGPTESGAGIKNGHYEIPVANGLAPGKYKVTVFSYDQNGPKVPSNVMPGDAVGVQFKERIPPKYNTETTLTAEVVKGKKNQFDYQLD
jgi:hypothetical protein